VQPSLDVGFLKCDLGDHKSVVDAVKADFKSDRLDVFIANAGVCAVPAALTKDGHEVQFGTNHFGHAVILKLLMPTLLRTADLPGSDVRVVFLSSSLYAQSPRGGIQFEGLRTTQDSMLTWTRYGQSKLANILYASEMARRYPSITAVSLHPGIVGTDLIKDLGPFSKAMVYVGAGFRLKTPADGAVNGLWAATAPLKDLKPGAYYEPVGKEVKLNSTARDGELAKKLWNWTEEQLRGVDL
jgi:NAD(P)-dependent dehydrogenase (short-subunit alcohol dehydrogenase family)